MYEVLLAVDENKERAVSQAETIAELPTAEENVRVVVLHIFEENPQGASVQRVGSARAASERLTEANVDHELVGGSGDPAETILDEANTRGVDLICVGGRRRSPTGKALFGSVAQNVILNAEQPVLTARAPVEG